MLRISRYSSQIKKRSETKPPFEVSLTCAFHSTKGKTQTTGGIDFLFMANWWKNRLGSRAKLNLPININSWIVKGSCHKKKIGV